MPDTTSSCDHRPVSTTGPQALTFMNGEFVQQQAGHFAERLQREAGQDPRIQIEKAFALALCRPPRPAEVQRSIDFLMTQQKQVEADARPGRGGADARRQALEAFCLVLLNTNEFVYMR